MQKLAPVEENKSNKRKEFEIQWLHESELSFVNEAKDTKVKTKRSCHLRKADEKSTKQQKLF